MFTRAKCLIIIKEKCDSAIYHKKKTDVNKEVTILELDTRDGGIYFSNLLIY